ncbi:hypothetical protein F2P81_000139 [Scophthalmus maximus]|uniref:Uncharacterized protein n=1 Tax=Scophthalmus maximus TaxID=52904 RepID=A0A6A4TG05_SCOMX|nr:hypothetical protein F2P81_000139 [Scophthalmus maximus]
MKKKTTSLARSLPPQLDGNSLDPHTLTLDRADEKDAAASDPRFNVKEASDVFSWNPFVFDTWRRREEKT